MKRSIKNLFILLLACTLVNGSVLAQKNYTMQEAVLGLSTNLAVENIPTITFRPKHDAYMYLNKDKSAWKYRDLKNEFEQEFLNLKITRELLKNDNIEIKSLPNITWLDQNHFYFFIKKDSKTVRFYHFLVKDSKKQIRPELLSFYDVPAEASNHDISSSLTMAYTIDNNLFFTNSNTSNEKISNEINPNIIYGQSVHRNEFGIHKGIFHSPKGNYIAFYRMDQTMVTDYPIIDWLQNTAVNNNIKYPMAGGVSHHVTVGVFNPNTKSTIYLKTGEPKEQYLTCVTWDPNEKYIYIAVLNRDQNHMKLNQYDAQTGEFVKTLFEEKHNKYVEPQHELYFLPNEKEFIWMSQRDGFFHAYLYNTDGKFIKQITSGNWLVKDILTIDEKSEWLYFTSTMKSPLGVNIQRVNLKNGKVESFNEQFGIGTRNVVMSSTGNYFIDNFRNYSTPRLITLVNTKSKKSETILNASNPLEGYNNSIVRRIELTTEDNIKLYGKLMLPHDFDSTKKYPVIVYLYNGPHAQLITESFPESGNLWYDYMTQRGFIVWSMDGRGSANRGLEFEQAIHNRLGEKESYDQMLGVNYLKSLPYVDANRMGIHGWSYGGFMTTYMMTHYPDVFKAGVAGGPVIDWRMYEIMYTERYMSSPNTNGAGYDKNNLLNHVKNLKGKLLMIHGADDDVVVWQHSMKFIKACVDNNIQIDYFVYPGHPHNVRGKDRVHLMQKISDYFMQNL